MVITPSFQVGDVGSIPTIRSIIKLPDGVAVAQMFLVHLGLVRIQLGQQNPTRVGFFYGMGF